MATRRQRVLAVAMLAMAMLLLVTPVMCPPLVSAQSHPLIRGKQALWIPQLF
jgi:hypothetical protein